MRFDTKEDRQRILRTVLVLVAFSGIVTLTFYDGIHDTKFGLLALGGFVSVGGFAAVVRRRITTKGRHGPSHTFRGWYAAELGLAWGLLGIGIAAYAAHEMGMLDLP